MSLDPNSSHYVPEPHRAADFADDGVFKIPNATVGTTLVRRPVGNPYNRFTNFPWATAGNTPGALMVTEDDTNTAFNILLWEHSGNL